MKKFLSVILAAVLVCAVGASMTRGTMAGFYDVELSTENYMCAGTRTLEKQHFLPIGVAPRQGIGRTVYLDCRLWMYVKPFYHQRLPLDIFRVEILAK